MSLKTDRLMANIVLEQDSTTLNYDLAVAHLCPITSVNRTGPLSVSGLTRFGIWTGIHLNCSVIP